MKTWDGETAPSVPRMSWELGGRMEEGSWKEREGSGHAAFHYSNYSWGFWGDSCSSVFRQNQQVTPKHITDPMGQQVLRFGAGRSTREKPVGKGLISAGIPWMEVQGEQKKLSASSG